MSDQPIQLGEDVRSELVGSAIARERGNRPVVLIVGGAVALLLALIYLVYGISSSAGANALLESEREAFARIDHEAGALLAMDSENRAAQERMKPNTRIQTQLELFASESEMITPLITVNPEPPGPGGVYRTKFSITLNDQTAESIFRWLARSKEIEGLTVTAIDLSPDLQLLPTTEEGTPRWQGRVEFSRYEKK